MDLCTGGDLKQNLVISKHGRFSEAKAKFYACEILLGLEDLHAKNIIYRDLKLENVLLDVKGNTIKRRFQSCFQMVVKGVKNKKILIFFSKIFIK